MKKFLSFALALICLSFALFQAGCKGCNGCNKDKNRTKYLIDVTIEDNLLTGVETVDFYNDFSVPVSHLEFNLHANAFRKDAGYKPIASQYINKAYKNGFSYGETNINLVTCSGENLPFEIVGQDKNVLKVTLPKEVFPNERCTVEIDYSITLANVVARTGINEHTVNLANFYPILCARDSGGFYQCLYYSAGDPYFSDCADYEVSVTTNADIVVASSGKLISQKQTNGKNKCVYKLNSARSFCLVLSDEFKVLKDEQDGVEILYYYYDDADAFGSVDTTKKALKLFNEKFANYPYSTYTVVQTEFLQGGMEFPGLVMISDALEHEAYLEVIVHETAHQWWQTMVGNNEIEHPFLDEGLAEYSVVLFYEKYPEYDMRRKDIISSCEKTFRLFCSITDKLDGEVNTSMLRGLNGYSSEYEYVNVCYVKPCIMFEYLRQSIGENKFFNGLKKYCSTYAFKNATPDDLIGAFESVGANANGFFEGFFSGKVII